MIKFFYKLAGREVPYYANYPLWLILWKPIRKFINVVIISNIPFSKMRIILYRSIGFKIGKKVFIGMKCYMDDMDPSKTIIEDNVIISYGCYFAMHGRKQEHKTIHIKKGSYIGMRCNILSTKKGITIGQNSIIGAGSLVNKSIPDNCVAAGVPVKVISNNK